MNSATPSTGLGGAVETRYAGQIRRYYEPDCPPPLDDGEQLPLFPDLDTPF